MPNGLTDPIHGKTYAAKAGGVGASVDENAHHYSPLIRTVIIPLCLGPLASQNVAGEEKGLVASTTNITNARRSVEPQLETCDGT
jgi:hypothetical protein